MSKGDKIFFGIGLAFIMPLMVWVFGGLWASHQGYIGVRCIETAGVEHIFELAGRDAVISTDKGVFIVNQAFLKPGDEHCIKHERFNHLWGEPDG